jgi:predicted ATPase
VSALVGRTNELAALDAALSRVRDGGGEVVTIGGEPGIGKSRLLAELAEAASAAGCVVLGAAASEFEDDLPYGVWTEALDPHLRGLDERRLARLGVDDFASLATAAGGDRHRLHRSLGELLEQLAATRPLLVWLDDAHWADAASLDAVAALVRRPPDAAVLLALAARAGRRPAALAAALAGAARDGRSTSSSWRARTASPPPLPWRSPLSSLPSGRTHDGCSRRPRWSATRSTPRSRPRWRRCRKPPR